MSSEIAMDDFQESTLTLDHASVLVAFFLLVLLSLTDFRFDLSLPLFALVLVPVT